MTKNAPGLYIVALSAVLLGAKSHAEDLQCDWQVDTRVTIGDGWIDIEQGRDENSERLKLAVSGPESVSAACEHLDDDDDLEVIVTSRGAGTGPYYRMQIIDFRPHGVLTWSYASNGMPKLENRRVLLGVLPLGYQGAATTPVYNAYQYTQENGLVELADEISWLLVVKTTVDSEETSAIESEFSSSQECMDAGSALVEDYLATYQEEAVFTCPSNRELREIVPTDRVR